MKLSPNLRSELAPLLVFGAHPDDIEFGCGGVVARETKAGRNSHFVICSRGESGSNGTPELRTAEASDAARLLGAQLDFLALDGDAHLEIRSVHAIRLASIIRRIRPGIVLVPSLVQNQHPDHWRLGTLVRDATRLARYAGLEELRDLSPHTIDQLFFYAFDLESEPRDITPVLYDVSAPEVVAVWTAAMEAHVSQVRSRRYVEFQLTRARMHGLLAGVEYAVPLFPNDPIQVDSLEQICRKARAF